MHLAMAAPRPELDDSLLSSLAEQRLALRVPVRCDIVVRDGFRRRRAELVDLSLMGCRLRFAEPVTADRRPWLWIPGGLGGRFAHPIGAEVAWTDALPNAPTGHCQVGMRFRRYPWRGQQRLQRALVDLVSRAAQGVLLPESEAPGERRASERRPYERRLIARGEGSPRVLLGRDLSHTGLRVESRTSLAIGARLQLALHAGGSVPLVLFAEVVRNAPDGSSALRFCALADSQRERIDELLAELPAPHGAEGCSLLVSQLEG